MKKRLTVVFIVAIMFIIVIGGLQTVAYAVPYCWQVCEDPETPLEQPCWCINISYPMNCFAWLYGWCPYG